MLGVFFGLLRAYRFFSRDLLRDLLAVESHRSLSWTTIRLTYCAPRIYWYPCCFLRSQFCGLEYYFRLRRHVRLDVRVSDTLGVFFGLLRAFRFCSPDFPRDLLAVESHRSLSWTTIRLTYCVPRICWYLCCFLRSQFCGGILFQVETTCVAWRKSRPVKAQAASVSP